MFSISDRATVIRPVPPHATSRGDVRITAYLQRKYRNHATMLVAALAALAFIAAIPHAEARGGRTTAQDCEAGSDDPDCPDTAAPGKSGGSSGNGSQTPPRK